MRRNIIKISELTEITSGSITNSDLMYITDSETSSSKKIQFGTLKTVISEYASSSIVVPTDYVTTSSFNELSQSYSNHSHTLINNDLEINGTLKAKTFHTQYVTSSIIYESGSTRFGDSSDDIHLFTGSIDITNDLTISGTNIITEINEVSESLRIHNHNLNDLTEKSYNSLTDKPSGFVSNGTSTFIPKYDSVNSLVTSSIKEVAGKVGIGYTTVNPGYTLDVSGKIRATENLYTNASLYSDVAIWSPVFKPRYDTDFTFQNYYSTVLGTFTKSGSFGIGVSAPNSKLHVNGNASISGSLIVSGSYIPTSPSSSGTFGQISWDSDYIYICTGSNAWTRTQITKIW